MNPWLFLFCGSVVVCVLQRRRINELKEDLTTQKAMVKAQEDAFTSFLYELHHIGTLPLVSSALGLTGLTISAITSIISKLKNLYVTKDYNTSSVILELHEIAHTELRMTYTALDNCQKSIRSTSKNYEQYQSKSDQ